MKKQEEKTQKCYNSFSCVAAVLIILFVIGSIIWDVCITKPSMHRSIEEIQVEVKEIHAKLDNTLQVSQPDTLKYQNVYQLTQLDTIK